MVNFFDDFPFPGGLFPGSTLIFRGVPLKVGEDELSFLGMPHFSGAND